MPDGPTLLVFATTALVVLLVPGPAVLYIVTRGATQGTRAALVSVLGIHAGTLFHVAAAVAGLSALVVASVTAFNMVKYAGAAYLVVLGIRALTSRSDEGDPSPADGDMKRVFRDGVLVNVLNPKTAVFFLAFVPQFVDPRASSPVTQILLLSLVFVAMGLVTDGAYAFASGALGRRWITSKRAQRARRRFSGIVYLGLGVATAVTGRHTTS